jgi:glutathione S-transferase
VQSDHCYPPLLGTPQKAGSKQALMDYLNDIGRFYLQDGKFICGFDHPTIADASFGTSIAHIAVHKDFALPASIAAYKERFAKACPTWDKVRAPLDGYIAHVHSKQAEAKETSPGTLYLSYGTRGSKVLWLAETLGVNFKIHKINLGKGENKSPEYLKKNPNGGVPTLELPNGDILFESSAIVMYLLDKYDPTNSLTGPPGSKARNQFLVYNAFSNEMEECVILYFLNTILYGERGDKALAKTEKENWDGHYMGFMQRLIEGAGSGNFANGTQNFLALDIICGYSLNLASNSGLTKSSPVLEAYVAKIRKHPYLSSSHTDK